MYLSLNCFSVCNTHLRYFRFIKAQKQTWWGNDRTAKEILKAKSIHNCHKTYGGIKSNANLKSANLLHTLSISFSRWHKDVVATVFRVQRFHSHSKDYWNEWIFLNFIFDLNEQTDIAALTENVHSCRVKCDAKIEIINWNKNPFKNSTVRMLKRIENYKIEKKNLK